MASGSPLHRSTNMAKCLRGSVLYTRTCAAWNTRSISVLHCPLRTRSLFSSCFGMSSLESNSKYLVGPMDNRIDIGIQEGSKIRDASKGAVSPIGNWIESSEGHPENAPGWIFRTVVGIVSEVNDLQSWKEHSSISSKPSGSSMETSEEHSANALFLILRTVVGIVTEVSDSQYPKEHSPISSSPSRNSMETSEEHPQNASG